MKQAASAMIRASNAGYAPPASFRFVTSDRTGRPQKKLAPRAIRRFLTAGNPLIGPGWLLIPFLIQKANI
jgi:hypothetical protein